MGRGQLVLAGGGHAHMMLLAHIETIVAQGHRVTVIQPSDHHYYSGMGPGMLSTHYTPDDIRFATRFVVERQGGTFVRAKAVRLTPDHNTIHTDTGETIGYDVLSCNVGSVIPFDRIEGSQERIFPAKPIERLLEARKTIQGISKTGRIAIGIVGGGPAAVEIAGNSGHLARISGCRRMDIRIFAGKKLMKENSPGIRKIIRKTFARRGIIVDESGYVASVTDGAIVSQNGAAFTPDIIFLATGVRPAPLFADAGLATGPDGGLAVNEYLQSTGSANIFGGGDCIHYVPSPLAKVGVYAVRENPVLLHNVMAALNGEDLQKFDPGGKYLLIFNLGGGVGALEKGPIVFGGKPAFRIKDYIDRKFMRTFQVLEKQGRRNCRR